MRLKSIILSAGIAALAATGLSGEAMAFSRWRGDLDAPSGPVRVGEVRLGDELATHVQDIGERDLNRLLDDLRDAVEDELARRGLLADAGDASAAELDLVMVSAKPNRPTFDQLSGRGNWLWDRPGSRPTYGMLSLASFGIGGVDLEGALTGADGGSLGEVTYSYEENDIFEAQFASTWTDAHRGIATFAWRIGETLTD